MQNHFVNLRDFSDRQLETLIERTLADKPAYQAGTGPAPLQRKALAMIFEKPSLRTRVSFETAMIQLGGAAIYLDNTAIGINSREAVQDIARVLGRTVDGIMARTFSHELVEQLALWAGVPVINALTDYSHPCQAMADLVTVHEEFGDLAGRKLVFVGDGNNVARSLAVACGRLGMRFALACPEGFELEAAFLDTLKQERPGGEYAVSHDPRGLLGDADVVYTDTWVSMGQEDEKAQRLETFRPYQLNGELMAAAPDHAIILHCLPAYRDCEITDDVFEAHAEPIFREAENRLHFQRTLLHMLLGEGGIA
jgi:ornithine carbamoyltransferase